MRKGIMSLEAIHFQDSSFFTDLTKAVSECWAESGRGTPYLDAIKSASAKKILKVIKEHTNLTVVYSTRYVNMGPAIMPVMVNPNHVFYPDWYRNDADFMEYLNDFAAKSRNTVLEASVDLKNSRVSGFFATEQNELIIPTLFLTCGIFEGANLTAAEAAAIIIHEVGHPFTFMEFVTRVNSGNQVLAYLNSKRLRDSPDQFKVVIANLSKSFGLSREQALALEKAKTTEDTAVMVMAIVEEKARSELGINLYDATAKEQLADQFAARHGAGIALLSASEKSGGLQAHGRLQRYSWLREAAYATLILGVCSIGGAFGMAIGSIYLALLSLSVFQEGDAEEHERANAYDNTESRPARIKHDLIERLKDRELTNAERTQLTDAVASIDKLIEEKKRFPSLSRHVALLLHSSRRKAYNFELLQKQLEAIAANHLFVQSAKLQTLV